MNNNSIRRKLLSWLLAPMILLLVMGVITDYFTALEPVSEIYDQHLVNMALTLDHALFIDNKDIAKNYAKVAEDIIRTDQQDLIFIAVLDGNGKLLAGSSGLSLPPWKNKNFPYFYDGIFNGKNVRVTIIQNEKANAYICVAETTNKRSVLVRKTLLNMVIPELIFALFAIFLVLIGVSKGLSPLARITSQINSRSVSDLSPVDEGETPEEVKVIIHALNELLKRLQSSINIQRQFLADAAHQLRTPLAGLKMQLELATQQSGAERVTTYDQILLSTNRIIKLTNQLLSLAKVESDEHTKVLTNIDLAEIVQKMIPDWYSRALSKNIDIGFNLNSVYVWGEEWLLSEMIENLLDNAIKYTPLDGCVTVSCFAKDKHALLLVDDNGVGIPEVEREKVFDRFYRIQAYGDGCGLGLSIVRGIVIYHRGTIEITASNDSSGTRVAVSLPIVKTAKITP